MLLRFYRSLLALCLAILTALAPVAPAFAQQQTGQPTVPPAQTPVPATQGQSAPPAQPQAPVPLRNIQLSNQDYYHGVSWFPNPIGPYTSRAVPEPILTNSPRLEQMVQDGKLSISLQDAVDLALQNNLDILVQEYNPWIAEANVLHTKGGGITRGAYTSLAANLPTFTFDPSITALFALDDKTATVNNPLLAGTGSNTAVTNFSALETHTATGDLGYSQTFYTGTSVTATFNNSRTSTSSTSNFFNPAVNASMQFLVTQPLLNGFGFGVVKRQILLAILNKQNSDLALRQSLMTDITNVANAYWELVFARLNVDVAKQAVALADKLYSDNQKQVDIGTLAPLDLVQAEAQVATANQELITAQTTVLQDELVLLNLISKNPDAPVLRHLEIIPTDTAEAPPPPVEQITLEDAVREAVTKRPDVLTVGVTLKADDINIHITRNELLPSLNASAYYATTGLAGNRIITTCTPVAPATTCTPPPSVYSGLGTSLTDVFTAPFPEYNAQLSLTIPIRNRQAQADNLTANLTKRQDELRYQQTVGNAIIAIDNAQIALTQDRVIVDAAAKTRDLDAQTLDAEQKKLQLGASTLFNVVSDQNILATAASAEARARVNLIEAKVNFDLAMGRTMETYNINISQNNSNAGQIQSAKDTLIPGTSSNGQLVVVDQQAAQSALPGNAAR